MSTSPFENKEADSKRPAYDVDALDAESNSSGDKFAALIAEDHQHEISLRTMSWQKAAWLLAGDQVCLAIMAQTWSLSVLGWVPGIITSAKFVYFRLMGSSHHAHSNTLIGWGVWAAVMAVIWIIAFLFAEVVPSMGDFLSLLGAAFDSFFGFIYFAIAYRQLYAGKLFAGPGRSVMTIVHVFIMIVGLFLLGPGLYAAVEAIVADYSGGTKPAFSCANVAI